MTNQKNLPIYCYGFILAALLPLAQCLGCIPAICEANPTNELRACPDSDGTCGAYGGKRHGNILVKAVDVQCAGESSIRAPFDGVMYYWRPFGGANVKKCADKGVKIEGTGQWQGYSMYISSIDPDFFGGKVKQGTIIGRSIALRCLPDRNTNEQPYVQVSLHKNGERLDPTYHLHNCMCTGQICESNRDNTLLASPFVNMKWSDGYGGVKGWRIACQLANDRSNGRNAAPELRAPVIYSPIEGKYLGRMRLEYDDQSGVYRGCNNDGVFIIGKGRWEDYEVRILNVRFRRDLQPGEQAIAQGQEIGHRLNCAAVGDGGRSPDEIFVEVRKNGKHVDISDNISAKNCSAIVQPLP